MLQNGEGRSKTTIQIPPPHLGPMLSLVRSYKLVKSMGILHSIAYTTVDEYLFFLRGVSRVMGTAKDAEGKALGRRGMYYLAAAVSDFFIPRQRMVRSLVPGLRRSADIPPLLHSRSTKSSPARGP